MLKHSICVGISTNGGMNPQLIRLEPIQDTNIWGKGSLNLRNPHCFPNSPSTFACFTESASPKMQNLPRPWQSQDQTLERVCSRFRRELWEDISTSYVLMAAKSHVSAGEK